MRNQKGGLRRILVTSLCLVALCGSAAKAQQEGKSAQNPGPLAIRPCVFNFNFAFYNFSETEGLEGKGVNSDPATFKPAAKGDVICFASVWDKAISSEVAVYVSGKGTVEWTFGAALSGGGKIFLPTLNSKEEFPGETGGPVSIPVLTVPTVAHAKVIAAAKA